MKHALKLLSLLLLVTAGAWCQNFGPVSGNLTAAGSTCATTNACLSITLSNGQATYTGGAAITLSGTWSATVQFEASGDNGVSWVAINATPLNSSTAVTNATGNGTWSVSGIAGLTGLRVRVSAFTSGTVVATLSASPASASKGGGGGGGGSAAGPQYAIQINADGAGTFGGNANVTVDSATQSVVRAAGGFASGATPPTACDGQNGCLALSESSSQCVPTAGTDCLQADPTAHALKYSYNGGALAKLPTTVADIIALWTGPCSSSNFLRGDGACAAAAGGTPDFAAGWTVSNATSGGVPYFDSTSDAKSSAALASGQFVLGGGAGNPPTTSFSIVPTTRGGLGIDLSSIAGGSVICTTATGTFSSVAETSAVVYVGGGSSACPQSTGYSVSSGAFFGTATSSSFSIGNRGSGGSSTTGTYGTVTFSGENANGSSTSGVTSAASIFRSGDNNDTGATETAADATFTAGQSTAAATTDNQGKVTFQQPYTVSGSSTAGLVQCGVSSETAGDCSGTTVLPFLGIAQTVTGHAVRVAGAGSLISNATSASSTTFTVGHFACLDTTNGIKYVVDSSTPCANGAQVGIVRKTETSSNAHKILVTPSIYVGSPGFATLTDGATVSWNVLSAPQASAGLTFTTHGGSRTLNVSNLVAGGSYLLALIQDSSGTGEGLTLGTGCTWKVSGGGSGAVSLSTGANARDVLSFFYDGTNCYANLNTNFN